MPRLFTLADEDPRLALDILGTDDVALIEREINAFCLERLGQGVARVRYASFSAGAGFGLVLDDGQSVFLKVCSARTSLQSLESVHLIQSALASRGFPAPRVLVPPQPCMGWQRRRDGMVRARHSQSRIAKAL